MNIRVLKIVTGLMIGIATVFVATSTLATVTSTTTQTTSALGNGSTQNFTIGFTFVDNDHIQVVLQDESTTPYTRTTLIYGAGAGKYTITGGDPGTTVVMGTAPTSTQRVIISRVTPRTQTVDYDENNAFPFDDHEAQMDRAMYAIQEQDSKITKTISLSPTSTASPVPTFPDPVANTFVQYDVGGSALTLSPASPTSGDVLKFDGSAWGKYALDTKLGELDAMDATKTNQVDFAAHILGQVLPHPILELNLAAKAEQASLDITNGLLSDHTSNTSNPHTVTAAQVGNSTAQWNADKIKDKSVSLAGASDGKVLTYQLSTDSLVLTPAPLAPSLTEAHLFVGDSSNLAVDTAVSGDIGLSTTGAMTVGTVGGKAAANIAASVDATEAATNLNTVSTIVKRDANGDFAASVITATRVVADLVGAVTGNASTASALAANPAACGAGQYATDIAADGTLTCGAVDALPSQTGNDGKYLRTDGSAVGWSTVDALPTQTGNAGKFLKTDGSAASWAPPASGGAKNFVANPSAAYSETANWTASADSASSAVMTVTRETGAGYKIDGIASFKLVTAADASGTKIASFTSDAMTTDDNVTGNCMVGASYLGADGASFTLELLSGADATLTSIALTAETAFRAVKLNYPCGTGYKLRVKSIVASKTLYIGAFYWGEASNVIDYNNQPQYDLTVTGTNWTTTRAVGTPYQTSDGAWRMRFNVRGADTTAGVTVTYAVTGVIFKNVANFYQACAAALHGAAGNISSCYAAPNTGNITVSTGSSVTLGTLEFSGDVELESKPAWATNTGSQTALTVDQTDAFAGVKFAATAISATLNAESYTTANAAWGTRTLYGKATAGGANNLEFTVPSLPPGRYLAVFNGNAIAETSAATRCGFAISDGVSTRGMTTAEYPAWQNQMLGLFVYDAQQTNKVFSIQGYRAYGNGNCRVYNTYGELEFYLVPLSQSLPAPILQNQVSTKLEGGVRIIHGGINADHTIAASGSGDWTTTGTTTGEYPIVFSPAFSSTNYACSYGLNALGANRNVYKDDTTPKATTGLTVFTQSAESPLGDVAFDFICVGPR